VGHVGEKVGTIAIAADDASAITQHTYDAAVLPVPLFVFIGPFHYAQEVLTHGLPRGYLSDVRNEAWPGPLFQLVQQGGLVF
jgi:hypothetical protein